MILAGASIHAQARGAPAGLLALRPVRYVGRISYSWYLWHWPALIFAAVIWGPLSVPAGLAVVAASWIPTAATHRWIEDPVRLSRVLSLRPNRALAIGLGCMAVGVGAGLLLTDLQPVLRTAPLSAVKGAAALPSQPYPQQRAEAVRPSPLRASADRSRMYYEGCLVGIDGTNSNRCLYGDRGGRRTLILFGDSHALQYSPALEALAKAHDWRLIVLTKAECSPAEVRIRSLVARREYTQCDAWREKELRRIELGDDSTVVVISGDTVYTPYGEGGEELHAAAGAAAMEAGYLATLTRIHRAGMRTVVIKDTPVSTSDVPGCVSESLQNLESCAFPWVHDRAIRIRRPRRQGGARQPPDQPQPEDLPRRPLPRGDRQCPRLPRQKPPHRDLRPHPRPADRARPAQGRPLRAGLSRPVYSSGSPMIRSGLLRVGELDPAVLGRDAGDLAERRFDPRWRSPPSARRSGPRTSGSGRTASCLPVARRGSRRAPARARPRGAALASPRRLSSRSRRP